jgi:uncharacterized protein DUF2752
MRCFSVPERVGFAGLAAAPVAFVYPAVHRATGLGLPCPLRTVTGVPCPMCGMTTAASSLAAGQLGGALAANPFVLCVVALVLCGLGVAAVRVAGLLGPPREWSAAGRRRVTWAAGLTAGASWLYQLHRFEFI